MNDATVGTEPAHSSPKTRSCGMQRATRSRRVMLAALVAASLVIGVSWWLAGQGSAPRALTDSSAAPESAGAARPRHSASTPEQMATATSQASARMPLPEAAELTHAAAADLAQLMHARDQLLQDNQDISQRLDRIESEVAGFRQQIEKRLAADALAPRKASTTLHSRHVARSMEPAPQTQEGPRVLGVDTWNGKPSVSILVGTDVRFFAEGDVVGSSYVKRADPTNQRVDFVTAAGAPATAVSALGNER